MYICILRNLLPAPLVRRKLVRVEGRGEERLDVDVAGRGPGLLYVVGYDATPVRCQRTLQLSGSWSAR